MISIRIVTADHYMHAPIEGLDPVYSDFRGSCVNQVPVIRIFGTTKNGIKTCLHVHGVLPYIFIPFSGVGDASKLSYQLALSIDKGLNILQGNNNSNAQHVFKVVLVSGKPIYGFHKKEHQYFKVFFYNWAMRDKAVTLLQSGAICNQVYQPHEAHVPYILQFFIDYNLYGMSFIHLASVKYRLLDENSALLDNVEESSILPKSVACTSYSKLEVDCKSVDILNYKSISGTNLHNPGIAAIWEDERRRRKVSDKSEIAPPCSQFRTRKQVHRAEMMYKEKLREKLQKLGYNKVSKSTRYSSVSQNYPAETPDDADILSASFIDRIESSQSTTLSETKIDDTFEETIVDEQMVWNLSQLNPAVENDVTLNSQDLELLEALQKLAGNREGDKTILEQSQISLSSNSLSSQKISSKFNQTDFERTITQNVDIDSILGTQIIPDPVSDDPNENSESLDEINIFNNPAAEGKIGKDDQDDCSEASIENISNIHPAHSYADSFDSGSKIAQCIFEADKISATTKEKPTKSVKPPNPPKSEDPDLWEDSYWEDISENNIPQLDGPNELLSADGTNNVNPKVVVMKLVLDPLKECNDAFERYIFHSYDTHSLNYNSICLPFSVSHYKWRNKNHRKTRVRNKLEKYKSLPQLGTLTNTRSKNVENHAFIDFSKKSNLTVREEEPKRVLNSDSQKTPKSSKTYKPESSETPANFLCNGLDEGGENVDTDYILELPDNQVDIDYAGGINNSCNIANVQDFSCVASVDSNLYPKLSDISPTSSPNSSQNSNMKIKNTVKLKDCFVDLSKVFVKNFTFPMKMPAECELQDVEILNETKETIEHPVPVSSDNCRCLRNNCFKDLPAPMVTPPTKITVTAEIHYEGDQKVFFQSKAHKKKAIFLENLRSQNISVEELFLREQFLYEIVKAPISKKSKSVGKKLFSVASKHPSKLKSAINLSSAKEPKIVSPQSKMREESALSKMEEINSISYQDSFKVQKSPPTGKTEESCHEFHELSDLSRSLDESPNSCFKFNELKSPIMDLKCLGQSKVINNDVESAASSIKPEVENLVNPSCTFAKFPISTPTSPEKSACSNSIQAPEPSSKICSIVLKRLSLDDLLSLNINCASLKMYLNSVKTQNICKKVENNISENFSSPQLETKINSEMPVSIQPGIHKSDLQTVLFSDTQNSCSFFDSEIMKSKLLSNCVDEANTKNSSGSVLVESSRELQSNFITQNNHVPTTRTIAENSVTHNLSTQSSLSLLKTSSTSEEYSCQAACEARRSILSKPPCEASLKLATVLPFLEKNSSLEFQGKNVLSPETSTSQHIRLLQNFISGLQNRFGSEESIKFKKFLSEQIPAKLFKLIERPLVFKVEPSLRCKNFPMKPHMRLKHMKQTSVQTGISSLFKYVPSTKTDNSIEFWQKIKPVENVSSSIHESRAVISLQSNSKSASTKKNFTDKQLITSSKFNIVLNTDRTLKLILKPLDEKCIAKSNFSKNGETACNPDVGSNNLNNNSPSAMKIEASQSKPFVVINKEIKPVQSLLSEEIKYNLKNLCSRSKYRKCFEAKKKQKCSSASNKSSLSHLFNSYLSLNSSSSKTSSKQNKRKSNEKNKSASYIKSCGINLEKSSSLSAELCSAPVLCNKRVKRKSALLAMNKIKEDLNSGVIFNEQLIEARKSHASLISQGKIVEQRNTSFPKDKYHSSKLENSPKTKKKSSKNNNCSNSDDSKWVLKNFLKSISKKKLKVNYSSENSKKNKKNGFRVSSVTIEDSKGHARLIKSKKSSQEHNVRSVNNSTPLQPDISTEISSNKKNTSLPCRETSKKSTSGKQSILGKRKVGSHPENTHNKENYFFHLPEHTSDLGTFSTNKAVNNLCEGKIDIIACHEQNPVKETSCTIKAVCFDLIQVENSSDSCHFKNISLDGNFDSSTDTSDEEYLPGKSKPSYKVLTKSPFKSHQFPDFSDLSASISPEKIPASPRKKLKPKVSGLFKCSVVSKPTPKKDELDSNSGMAAGGTSVDNEAPIAPKQPRILVQKVGQSKKHESRYEKVVTKKSRLKKQIIDEKLGQLEPVVKLFKLDYEQIKDGISASYTDVFLPIVNSHNSKSQSTATRPRKYKDTKVSMESLCANSFLSNVSKPSNKKGKKESSKLIGKKNDEDEDYKSKSLKSFKEPKPGLSHLPMVKTFKDSSESEYLTAVLTGEKGVDSSCPVSEKFAKNKSIDQLSSLSNSQHMKILQNLSSEKFGSMETGLVSQSETFKEVKESIEKNEKKSKNLGLTLRKMSSFSKKNKTNIGKNLAPKKPLQTLKPSKDIFTDQIAVVNSKCTSSNSNKSISKTHTEFKGNISEPSVDSVFPKKNEGIPLNPRKKEIVLYENKKKPNKPAKNQSKMVDLKSESCNAKTALLSLNHPVVKSDDVNINQRSSTLEYSSTDSSSDAHFKCRKKSKVRRKYLGVSLMRRKILAREVAKPRKEKSSSSSDASIIERTPSEKSSSDDEGTNVGSVNILEEPNDDHFVLPLLSENELTSKTASHSSISKNIFQENSCTPFPQTENVQIKNQSNICVETKSSSEIECSSDEEYGIKSFFSTTMFHNLNKTLIIEADKNDTAKNIPDESIIDENIIDQNTTDENILEKNINEEVSSYKTFEKPTKSDTLSKFSQKSKEEGVTDENIIDQNVSNENIPEKNINEEVSRYETSEKEAKSDELPELSQESYERSVIKFQPDPFVESQAILSYDSDKHSKILFSSQSNDSKGTEITVFDSLKSEISDSETLKSSQSSVNTDVGQKHEQLAVPSKSVGLKKFKLISPKMKPPTSEEVLSNMWRFGIPSVRNVEPFYSDYNDNTGRKEIGGMILNVKSKSVKDLEEFQSHFLPAGNQCSPDSDCLFVSSQKKCENFDASTSFTERKVILTPVNPAPTFKEANEWLKARKLLKDFTVEPESNCMNTMLKSNNLDLKPDPKNFSKDTTNLLPTSPIYNSLLEHSTPLLNRKNSKNILKTSLFLTPVQSKVDKMDTDSSDGEKKSKLSLSQVPENTESPLNETLSAEQNKNFNASNNQVLNYSLITSESLNKDLNLLHETNISFSSAQSQTSVPEKFPKVNSGSSQFQKSLSAPSSISEKNSQSKNVTVSVLRSDMKDESSQSSNDTLADTTLRRKLLNTQYRKELLSPRSRATASCCIEGPSPKNSGNFKMDLENFQGVKTVVEYQYLTVFVMELHVKTRGDLHPDPDFDPVEAVFYSITNDVPPDEGKTHETGVIAVAKGANEGIAFSEFDCVYQLVEDEKSLIQEVINLVRRWDPDILAGYEIEMLSWNYLIERGYSCDFNLNKELARVKNAFVRKYTREDTEDFSGIKEEDREPEIRLTGRIVFNIWRLLRSEVALQSYSFENIVYHVLHQRIPLHSFKNLTLWWSHRSGLFKWITIQYYLTRVEGTIQILDQLDLIGRTCELARLFGILFYEVLSRGSQFRVESMMLRLAKPHNYVAVSPSTQQRARMRAPESLPLIMEPESRFYHDPVIVLDFQSLYPSIIIAYNYCFSTCLGRIEHLADQEIFEFGCTQLRVPFQDLIKLENNINIAPCGAAFVKKKIRKGLLPAMLEEILETRLMVKQSMKLHKSNKVLQRVLHSRQLGLKLIANVTYGYTAANFSGRMPCIEVGDSVVSKGRETLGRAIEMVNTTEKWGTRVIYGDTDSLFVLVPGRSREDAFKIGAEIAEAVTNDNPTPVKLKLEKIYQPCILQTKKRYVGYMYESPDQEKPVYDAKGIETVRRDGCPAVAKILQKCLCLLFETSDLSHVKKYVSKQFSKILSGRVSIQDVTFAREYRGAVGYKPGACVPALQLAQQWLASDPRSEPRVCERVPYVVVAGPPGLPIIRLVRSPHELLADPSLKINSEYYITRVIIPPLDRCFSLLGVNLFAWYAELPRKLHTYLPSSAPNALKKSTISQYFATTNCVVCSEQTHTGICSECQPKPQLLAISLMTKINVWERKYNNCIKICQSCCGRLHSYDCSSLDCPVLYRRAQTSRDLDQIPFLRQLQKDYLDF